MQRWVHVDEISGQGNKEVQITVDSNPFSERRTKITGKTLNGKTDTLTIIQKAGPEDMDAIIFKLITEDNIYFDEVIVNGNSIELDKTSNEAGISQEDFDIIKNIILKGNFICNYQSGYDGSGIYLYNLKDINQYQEKGFKFTFTDITEVMLYVLN